MNNMGIRRASNALTNLWEYSKNTLGKEQLEWYAGLSDAANQEAQNIADHLTAFGLLLNDADQSAHPTGETMASILFSLATQVNTIAALVQIGTDADFRLAEMESVEEQFVTATNWANYSLDVCGNRYRFIDKATQDILLQFVAASDDEAEEICTDFLRRRGMQAKKKKPD
jgi:hypothetical protein